MRRARAKSQRREGADHLEARAVDSDRPLESLWGFVWILACIQSEIEYRTWMLTGFTEVI